MPELPSDHHVTVSAQERSHPAIRKLARACLELARQVVGMRPDPRPVSSSQDTQPERKP